MPKIAHAKSCCTPPRNGGGAKRVPLAATPAASRDYHDHIKIPSARGLLGTNHPRIENDGETPLRHTKIAAFRIAPTTVTNGQFKSFVDATGYVTDAEKFGWSFVFWAQVPDATGATHGVLDADWWRHVDGANWRDINGPNTFSDAWHPDHPVVQVSWHDAKAYCDWVGGRLPSEAEWEHATRAGMGDVPYPWGDVDPTEMDFTPCNIWQGQFPDTNTRADGYATTAPAQSFEPNGFGLYNLVGNVWEWTGDAFTIKSLKKDVRTRLAQMRGYKTSKGGSFLCHKSYCERYRIAARSGSSPDSATTHHGFRVVWTD